ncbi:hypothetical protein L873DRAFT_1438316 [Choiromyces venosus 120613-1]|uniref:Uncharacterized protein n=1 Tax=Choiromyces venosus 120613-1 TaxID=1336337 RepID=A0A3N4J831_9PEZI|nr:hypothetical protein L873DRAFT_1438316 [Choiromyces venosus 120613-1]
MPPPPPNIPPHQTRVLVPKNYDTLHMLLLRLSHFPIPKTNNQHIIPCPPSTNPSSKKRKKKRKEKKQPPFPPIPKKDKPAFLTSHAPNMICIIGPSNHRHTKKKKKKNTFPPHFPLSPRVRRPGGRGNRFFPKLQTNSLTHSLRGDSPTKREPRGDGYFISSFPTLGLKHGWMDGWMGFPQFGVGV